VGTRSVFGKVFEEINSIFTFVWAFFVDLIYDENRIIIGLSYTYH
jgi:hypothetical protein